jgi:Transposase, Mutator family
VRCRVRQRSSERVKQLNGYRQRQFDTRAGTLDLAIPKLRHGSYSPDWLLERRTRAEGPLGAPGPAKRLQPVDTARVLDADERAELERLRCENTELRSGDGPNLGQGPRRDWPGLSTVVNTSSGLGRANLIWKSPEDGGTSGWRWAGNRQGRRLDEVMRGWWVLPGGSIYRVC